VCSICGKEQYRSLSHKRFVKSGLYFFDIEKTAEEFNFWLSKYAWQDIEYIQFSYEYIDVVYMDKIMIKGETNDKGEAQISMA